MLTRSKIKQYLRNYYRFVNSKNKLELQISAAITNAMLDMDPITAGIIRYIYIDKTGNASACAKQYYMSLSAVYNNVNVGFAYLRKALEDVVNE